MPVLKLTQTMISQGIPLPDDVARLEACDQDFPGLYLELRATSLGQGTYYYRYKDNIKKTCHQRIGTTAEVTLADARKQAKTLKAEIALGANPKGDEKAKKAMLTFTEFFNDHYLPYVTPRKRSWKRDEELFRLRIQKVFGDKRLNEITRQQIQSFHTALLAEGLAPATCDHHVKLLKHAFNLAIDWDLLTEKNPAARVPLLNVDNRLERYLDDAELQRLLHVLGTDPNRMICLVAMFLLSTGARLNEALSAKWNEVDRQTRVWRIPASSAKSKKLASVPLSDSAIDVLNQLDTERKFEHLFINRRTGKRLTTIMKVWTRLRAKADLPNLRLHDLRHQYASFLVNAGHSLYSVQKVLRHASSSTTERYSHLSTKTLQDAANSASLMIRGAMPVALPMDLPLLVDLAIPEAVDLAVAA